MLRKLYKLFFIIYEFQIIIKIKFKLVFLIINILKITI